MTKVNRAKTLFPLLLAGGVACSAPPDTGAPRVDVDQTLSPATLSVESPITAVAACPNIPGQMRCYSAMLRPNRFKPFTLPPGLGPTGLASAYNFASVTAPTPAPTIGIIDWYDDANAEADLGVYRTAYSLGACTTANGCFSKVDQYGNTITAATTAAGDPPLPSSTGGAGTDFEISLDIEMASAVCPTCKILLVEANSGYMEDLGAAVNTAVRLGATVVSNSYGGGESASDATFDTAYFEHVGVTIFASAGDHLYTTGVSYPASGAWVVGVGGTSLTVDASNARGWDEVVWNDNSVSGLSGWGTQSGCSAYTPIPAWQGVAAGEPSGCSKKMVADVSAQSADADAVAVYDSLVDPAWNEAIGTSVASPIMASLFALTGLAGVSPGWIWDNKSDFYDITVGNNNPPSGTCSPSAWFCVAQTGYDGPTGWGSPNGALLAARGPQWIKQATYWKALMEEKIPGDLLHGD
jgi:hypothetical protein